MMYNSLNSNEGSVSVNDKNKEKAESLIILTVIFTIIGMLAQCAAVLFGYDPTMCVYKYGSVLGDISAVLLFSMIVIISVITFRTMRSGKAENSPVTDNLTAFLSAMSGASMIVSSAIVLFENVSIDTSLRTASAMLMGTSVLSGLYFILFAMSDKKSIATMILGFFPPIWGASCLLRIYFDDNSVINDPIRILFQVSVVAVMLALLYELRVRVGKNGRCAFVIASFISVILGFSSGLSMLLLYFITKTVTTGEMLLSVTEVIICLYLLARAYSFVKVSNKNTSEE